MKLCGSSIYLIISSFHRRIHCQTPIPLSADGSIAQRTLNASPIRRRSPTMSQLSKAPLRSAKHLKKVKEMKHVETAIKWHERARKKRQATMADAWESKQTVLRGLRWEKGNIQDVKRRALKEAREDWKLGPLRPNRAVGQEAQTYGAMSQEGMRRPPVPVRVQKNRNEVLEKQGKELKYPIVVDDKKYFHIVAGDRVVVIKGREQGKIGTVYDILPESHEVIVKDINKVRLLTLDVRTTAHIV